MLWFTCGDRDRNIAAMRSSSFVDATREPAKLRSPSIKSRISLSDGCLATTTAPGSRRSVAVFETEVVTVELLMILAPANEIVASAANAISPTKKNLSALFTTST